MLDALREWPSHRRVAWRRSLRLLGTTSIIAGALVLCWVVVVWRWQDPFTALYTHFQQERLASAYERRWKDFVPVRRAGAHASVAPARIAAANARAYGQSLRRGDPVGRLKIGRIGLNMILVEGTDHTTLEKGPGHYVGSGLPGQGKLIYIAGHRTTYLAPFADINDIRNGDYMTFQVPYGTFWYRAFRHYIVRSDDLGVLVNHSREILRLQACHPRFFATHRYIVDARLVAFKLRGSASTVTTRFGGSRAKRSPAQGR